MAYFSGLTSDGLEKNLVDGETTRNRLARALIEQQTEFKPVPGTEMYRDSPMYDQLQRNINCDEVYPGIYMGNRSTATDTNYLLHLGITHVLNAAEGHRSGCVSNKQHFYKGTTIKYRGLPLTDLPTTDISRYLYTAAAFIEDAVKRRGKVYVHGVRGISRSATCVIAYMMIKKDMLAAEAIRKIRRNRAIHPNDGFLRQLAALDNELRRFRL